MLQVMGNAAETDKGIMHAATGAATPTDTMLLTDTQLRATPATLTPIHTPAVAAMVELDVRYTASRLSAATLGYLVAMTLVVTLTPFRFATRPLHGLTAEWSVADIVMNVVMFMPLGFLFGLGRGAGKHVALFAFLLGLTLSCVIEVAQLFEATRYTSVLDVGANALGAWIGAHAYLLITRRLEDEAVATGVKALALELPLMGLVYLLVPLFWLVALAASSGTRVWLALPVAAFGGGIVGAVHGGYVAPVRATSRVVLVAWTTVWSLVAGIMLLRHVPWLYVVSTCVAVLSALTQSYWAHHIRSAQRTRRIELPALRVVMPLFAGYLALSALWPLDGADLHWRAGLQFFPASQSPVDADVYRALEQIAAFTLVGYLIAEVRGRFDRPYREVVWTVCRWGGGLALMLELTRGLHPGYGASVILGCMAVAATVFGGWLYHLQRDHIRMITSGRLRHQSG